MTATSQRKIDTAIELMDTHVDTADLLAQLAIPIPTVTTPQMFTYQLLDRARSDCKRIVLPEGEDDRILNAAGRLLQRGVADLTTLIFPHDSKPFAWAGGAKSSTPKVATTDVIASQESRRCMVISSKGAHARARRILGELQWSNQLAFWPVFSVGGPRP